MKKIVSTSIKYEALKRVTEMVADDFYALEIIKKSVKFIDGLEWIEVSEQNINFDEHTAYCIAELAIDEAVS